MTDHGVIQKEIAVFEQPLNLSRFHPSTDRGSNNGPLRICYVGSLDLRKGFVYLLRAIRSIGSQNVSLEIVGATGDRCCNRLFARELANLDVRCAAGDPVPALRRAELFVSPTLEDGFSFAVAEAMACGLPVIVTECCGAAEWVRHGESGWITASADIDALAAVLETALNRRKELNSMGLIARQDTEHRARLDCLPAVADWFLSASPQRSRLP
ncbi:MAG: glycosyltransferase family 4 protein [Candidatus Binataceae bacterium]